MGISKLLSLFFFLKCIFPRLSLSSSTLTCAQTSLELQTWRLLVAMDACDSHTTETHGTMLNTGSGWVFMQPLLLSVCTIHCGMWKKTVMAWKSLDGAFSVWLSVFTHKHMQIRTAPGGRRSDAMLYSVLSLSYSSADKL